MSTFSRSATSAALRSGRTLKPMTMAFEAVASSTSDSLMAPTPELMTRTLVFVVGQLRQRVGQHLGRALHVGLDDEREFLHAALGDVLLQRLERQAAALGAERLRVGLLLAEPGDLARLGRSSTAWKVSPGVGTPRDRALPPASTDRPRDTCGRGRPAARAPCRRWCRRGRCRRRAACRPAPARSPPDHGRDRACLRAPCRRRCAPRWP